MIPELRKEFNNNYSTSTYEAFLKDVRNEFNYNPSFRIAETPIFIPNPLKEKLVEACDEILEFINDQNFKHLTDSAINHPTLNVPAEDYNSRFIQLDFGICIDDNGELIPQLIELQGFPSLYFYQDFITGLYRKHFNIPEKYSIHINGMKRPEFLKLLHHEIVGETPPQQIVLLEVEPEKQATRIDFLCAEKMLGIKVLCISSLLKEEKELFYINELGEKIKILKIYNRVIFDELNQRDDLPRSFHFTDEVDVEWIGHPNWFYRISKFTLPLLKSKYVPESLFLNQLEQFPDDLSKYVLKPLYSFAGSGVLLHLKEEILNNIPDKENYILQRKVQYAPVIETLDDPAKCEIRMMALYNTLEKKTNIVCNLVRLTKGEMVGTKYNKDRSWVGGSVAFFEND